MSQFVAATKAPTGARAVQVAALMDILAKGDGPIGFEDMCAQAEIKYPQDVQPAMHALELAGAIKRYTFVESVSTRKRIAYAIVEGGEKDRPSSAASTRRSSGRRSSKQRKASPAKAKAKRQSASSRKKS